MDTLIIDAALYTYQKCQIPVTFEHVHIAKGDAVQVECNCVHL